MKVRIFLSRQKVLWKIKSRFANPARADVAGMETKSATKYKIAASAGVLNGISESGMSNLISHQLQMCEVRKFPVRGANLR